MFRRVIVGMMSIALLSALPSTASAASAGGDDFADATEITSLPFTASQSTIGMTVETYESELCGSGYVGATVWFSYTPSTDVALSANTYGSDFDTLVGVYTGSWGDLDFVDCSWFTGFGVEFGAAPGTTYWIQVGGFFGAQGDLVFNLSETSQIWGTVGGWPAEATDCWVWAMAVAEDGSMTSGGGGCDGDTTGPATYHLLVPPGEYAVAASMMWTEDEGPDPVWQGSPWEWYSDRSSHATSDPVVVTEGASVQVDFVPDRPSGTIAGTFRDADSGEPLTGAFEPGAPLYAVEVLESDGILVARVGNDYSDGAYEVTLAAGDYVLLAHYSGDAWWMAQAAPYMPGWYGGPYGGLAAIERLVFDPPGALTSVEMAGASVVTVTAGSTTTLDLLLHQTPLCGGMMPTLLGTSEADQLLGTEGDDVIVGLGGDDVITALGGRDRVCAGGGDDTVVGQGGRDRVWGGGGNDTIMGGGKGDRLRGGTGRDRLEGQNGSDRLWGNKGADAILGGVGDDTIVGGGGDDTLAGNRGDDMIDGSGGLDLIDGGEGTDTCVDGVATRCEAG
jgi:hypothetical protein